MHALATIGLCKELWVCSAGLAIHYGLLCCGSPVDLEGGLQSLHVRILKHARELLGPNQVSRVHVYGFADRVCCR